MLSLEPATITERRYPLLFQTGETAFGDPITNAQHPHDLVMELSVQYSHSVGERATFDLYYGVVGDPALGPVAYPHRASAMEIPQATLGHHWEDSTHIANNVVTGVLAFKWVRFEASGFHGGEPDENRWNFDFGPMDSYSGRITFTPTPRWAAQISAGHLTKPEAVGTRRRSPHDGVGGVCRSPPQRQLVGNQRDLGPELEDCAKVRFERGACGDCSSLPRQELRHRPL